MATPSNQVVKAPELRLTWITGALTAIVPGVVGAVRALGGGDRATMIAGVALVALAVIALIVVYAIDVRARTDVTVAAIQARAANSDADKIRKVRDLAQEQNGLLDQITG